jgi:NADH-quinone oxidoreductase subunit C
MKHEAILETIEAFSETTLIADPARIVDLSRYLKTQEGFLRLSSVTAVDWHPSEPRFEVVYHLHSLDKNQRIRVKCRLASAADGAKPQIDSVYSVWRAADWYEREVFDLFGIEFRNHPNMTRILMPLDWEGHPLRKDYPVHGYKYSYPSDK